MKNKLLFLVCLLTIALSQAQIVNIPDANFKAKLLEADTTNFIAKDLSGDFFKIDANNDGEIHEDEALEVAYLDLSFSDIIDLEGIDYFINLKTLNCDYNNLVTLDLSANINLEFIDCIYNSLTELNLENNINLKGLSCDHNNLAALNIDNNSVLEILSCNVNDLTSLSLGIKDNLGLLYCHFNNLTSLNLDGVVNLSNLDCRSNEISTLDVIQNPNLYYLDCTENNLADLDVTQNINIDNIHRSREIVSKNIIKNTLNKYPGNQYSLWAFAWEYIQVLPFTSDKNIFLTFLSWLDNNNISKQGTNFSSIFSSLETSLSKENENATIVILTDAENLSDTKFEKYNYLEELHINTLIVWIWTAKWWLIPIWTDAFWRTLHKIYDWEKVVSQVSHKENKIFSEKNNL